MDWAGLASGAFQALSTGTMPLGDWSGGWTNFSSNQSKMKDALKRQYDYAQRYAENAPTWNVTGLRNAGINPILAVNGGNISQVTAANPSMGDSGSGSFSFGRDINKDLREQQVGIAKETKDNITAQTNKIKSDIQVNNARIANLEEDTQNKANTRGNSGFFGFLNQISQDTTHNLENLLKWNRDTKSSVNGRFLRFIRDDIPSFMSKVAPFSINTATTLRDGARDVKKALDKMELDKNYKNAFSPQFRAH